MSRNARIWIGLTLLFILAFNYSVIGFPLLRKSAAIHDKSTTMLMKQIKSGKALKSGEDEYILEVFAREKTAIDSKVLILNCVAASLLIIIASWTIFGLIVHRKK